ncbi:MAG: hypothetical protein ACM3JD_19220, partial [Rudaea sp.]
MKRLLLAALLTVMLLLAFGLGVAVGTGQPPDALYATVVENATGETPQDKIGAYVRAIIRGDERAALAAWELPDWQMPDEQARALAARREQVTRQLMATRIAPNYHVLGVEWWGTCCEPRIIQNSRDAGGARVDVQFLDPAGAPLVYRFDLFTRGGAYWGAAEGYPVRQ